MSANKDVLENILALSIQLNRQAFARPPVEGWLTSLLSMLHERFASGSVQGVQVAQVIGNAAVPMAQAGTVPTLASSHYTLEDSSPIAVALKTRQMVSAPDMRVFPLLVGDGANGVLIVYATEPDRALDQALGMLSLQLGVAIAQQIKPTGMQTGRLTRQIDMMRSLAEATQTVSSTLEGTEALNRGARSLVEALHIDHASIIAFDYARDEASMVAEYPDHGFVGMKLELHGSPVNEALIRDHLPIIIPNVAEAAELGKNQAVFEKLGLKSMILLPMLALDELIGSVGIESYYEDRTLTPEEMEGALAITAQLAISVRNTHLFDEMKRRATQLEKIADLSRRVTSTFDRLEIFGIIREETQSMLEAEQVSVSILEGNGSRLRLFLLDGVTPKIVDFDLEKTALRFILVGAEPLVLDDISGSDYPDYKLLTQTGMHAALIVPLIAGGRTIGTYNIAHSEPGKYSSIDLAVLEQIGNQLAIALENARLFTQTAQRGDVERLMNRMGGSIQQGGDMQSILLNTLQQVAEALNARRARVRLEMPSSRPEHEQATGKLVGKRSRKKEAK